MWKGHVDGNAEDGKATPIHLIKGEVISINATGWVNFDGGNDNAWAAPEGPTPAWGQHGVSHALVATIGDDKKQIPIGNGKLNWHVPAAGLLTFLFADAPGAYSNNSGSFEVEVVREGAESKPVTCTLDATNEEGVKSGVTVSSGDKISITVTGKASYGPSYPEFGPDGDSPGHGLLPSANTGACLMRIGGDSNPYRLVGSELSDYTVQKDEHGEITFFYNDSPGQFGNNRGSFKITLSKK